MSGGEVAAPEQVSRGCCSGEGDNRHGQGRDGVERLDGHRPGAPERAHVLQPGRRAQQSTVLTQYQSACQNSAEPPRSAPFFDHVSSTIHQTGDPCGLPAGGMAPGTGVNARPLIVPGTRRMERSFRPISQGCKGNCTVASNSVSR